MFLKLLIILIFVTTLLSSCSSYRLGNNKPVKYKNIDSIAVPIVQSDVLKPKLQSLVTNAIIRSIQEKGAFKIAKEKNSDATLNIKIINIERKQLRASRENVLRTTEMEFIIEIEYRVLSNLDGVTIERGNVKAKSSSYLNPNFQLTENHSLRDAAEKLAISLANKLSEGY